jgi:hypothetical protein
MDKTLQKYYEGQFDMMASDSWKELVADLVDLKDNYVDIRNCEDGNMLHFRKGQVDILEFIINRKEFLERGYEELTNAKENI